MKERKKERNAMI